MISRDRFARISSSDIFVFCKLKLNFSKRFADRFDVNLIYHRRCVVPITLQCDNYLLLSSSPSQMQFHTAVLAMLLLAVAALAYPQKDGQIFSNEAIRQAQNTYLIPKDATIQKVQEGIELAAYESIPGDQRINLFEILGEHVPPEVVNNLQSQIDQIGRN